MKERIAFMGILCFLLLGFSYGSVFYLNTSQPYDVQYNDTDSYSAWLDYLNPYSIGTCDDLRECYIDDSNVISPFDHNFVTDNFFADNPNLVPIYSNFTNKESKQQLNPDGVPYTRFAVAFYNDTSDGLIDVIVQRGTVWETYEDLTVHNDTYIVDTVGWFNQSSIGYYDILDNSFYKVMAYDLYTAGNVTAPMAIRSIFLKNDEVTIILFQYDENGEKVDSTALIVNHYDQYEFGYSLIGNTTTADLAQISSTSGTDYHGTLDSLLQFLSNQYQQTNLVQHLTHKFHGLYLDISNPLTRNAFVVMPKIQYKPETFKSVSLPSCEDIATGNRQTDLSYNATTTQWRRTCEGVVPTPETYTCDLECLEYGDSYIWNSKEVASSLIPSSAVQYNTHISIFDRGDGYGFIFPSGTDPADIGQLRIFSYLEMESIYENETYSIKGYAQLGNSYGSLTHVQPYSYFDRTCYYGLQNVTAPHIWGYFGGVLDENIAQTYTDVTNDDIYYWVDWIDINAYYTAQFDITQTDAGCVNDIWIPVTTSTSKKIYVRAEWENVTEVGSYCTTYESVCYPEVPDGYTYDQDDVICVGISCYVESGLECDIDGYCNSPFETTTSCPDDCVIPTPEEISDTIDNILGDLGASIGTDAVGMKFIIWTIISLALSMLLSIAIAKAGAGSGAGIAFIISMILWILIGSVITWIPIWIGIVFVILAGFMLSVMLRGIFLTG